jgi:hypothetical protein
MALDIDNLLSDLYESTQNTLLGGDHLFALEGHAELKLFRVVTLNELYRSAVIDFGLGISSGYCLHGIFAKKEDAWKFSENVSGGKQIHSKLDMFHSDTHYVLEGEPSRNELAVNTYQWGVESNVTLYLNSVNRNWLCLGIFINEEAARLSESIIRMYVRGEDGKPIDK